MASTENAAKLAREAIKLTSSAESARLVLGRIYLERYRQSAEPEDLAQAREALQDGQHRRASTAVNVAEWTIGLGEALYLDDHFGPAVELFERALDGPNRSPRLSASGCSTGGRPPSIAWP